MELLAGDTALVTGAASGIGRGIAKALAAEGARLVLSDIAEQAGTALAVAVDGARTPEITARRRHLFAVEVNGDLAWRSAGDVFSKNAPHDRSLGLHYRALAALASDRRVAVSQSPAGEPLSHSPSLAAADMHRKLFQVKRAHQAFEAGMHLGH